MKNQRPSSVNRTPQRPLPEATVEITEVAYGGDGVGRVDSRVWFVPLTLPGEKVRARARQVHKSYVRAELLSVEEAAPERIVPPCPLFGQCGGCRYQHANYEWQLEVKRTQVVSLLRRLSGLSGKMAGDVEELVAPVVPAPVPYGYRNRITVHIRDGVVGFHSLHGQGLIDVEACLLADPTVQEKLTAFRERRPFDGHRTLRAYEEVGGFRQTHDAMAELLRNYVAEQLREASGILLDVYGGAGFFSQTLSSQFSRIYVMDWSASAMQVARRNPPQHWTIVEADVAESLPAVLRKIRETPGENVFSRHLLLDPPAEGLEREVVTAILSDSWASLTYVSCDPATLARDVGRLAPRFLLKKVQPFDMFPQTAGIEVVATFQPLPA